MFDIGFWELAVIAVVALIVVGPEEFPALLRNMGAWIGKARRIIGDFKHELDREVSRAEELKRLIAKENQIADAHRALEKAGARLNVTIDSAPKEGPATESGSAPAADVDKPSR